jgi:hypothetical protein
VAATSFSPDKTCPLRGKTKERTSFKLPASLKVVMGLWFGAVSLAADSLPTSTTFA